MTPDLYGAVIDEAHKRGFGVTAHIANSLADIIHTRRISAVVRRGAPVGRSHPVR